MSEDTTPAAAPTNGSGCCVGAVVSGAAPGPFGAPLDNLARERGNWASDQMVYGIEVIGQGEDPQVLLTGAAAKWMPRAKRWSFKGFPSVKAVVLLSEYRAAYEEHRAAISKARGEA